MGNMTFSVKPHPSKSRSSCTLRPKYVDGPTCSQPLTSTLSFLSSLGVYVLPFATINAMEYETTTVTDAPRLSDIQGELSYAQISPCPLNSVLSTLLSTDVLSKRKNNRTINRERTHTRISARAFLAWFCYFERPRDPTYCCFCGGDLKSRKKGINLRLHKRKTLL